MRGLRSQNARDRHWIDGSDPITSQTRNQSVINSAMAKHKVVAPSKMILRLRSILDRLLRYWRIDTGAPQA